MNRYAQLRDDVVVGIQTSSKLIEHPEYILIEGEIPRIGDIYSDGIFTTPVVNEPEIPKIQLANVNIDNARLVGDIYWVLKGAAIVITADVPLPDGEYMVMIERVVDAAIVVDDERFIATVVSGKLTINGTFQTTGNYLLSANRVNRGLDRIGAGAHLVFDDVEFDVYV